MFGRASGAFGAALVLAGLALGSAALNEQSTEGSEFLDLLTVVFIVAASAFLVLSVIFGLIFVGVWAWRYLHGVAFEENGTQQLIRVTPSQGSNMTPINGSTVWEIDAYLDVETIDQSRPLLNCRIKLLELEHFDTWIHKDKGKETVIERWSRDSFYQGQRYLFSWSGKSHTVEAVDVPRSERASIAKCVNQRPEWTTTEGAVGHLFYGDQYHLIVEVTADNSLPLTKEYWLQMFGGNQPIIEEWNANPRPGLGTEDSPLQ